MHGPSLETRGGVKRKTGSGGVDGEGDIWRKPFVLSLIYLMFELEGISANSRCDIKKDGYEPALLVEAVAVVAYSMLPRNLIWRLLYISRV